MKKMMKRALLLLLAAMMALTLFSCGSTETVMELDGHKVSLNAYSYWLSVYKSYFLYYYNRSNDTVAFWQSTAPDGRSYEQYATDIVRSNVKRMLVAEVLFDSYGLKLDAETVAAIKESIDAEIEYYGSKAAFNQVLSKLNINADILKDIYTTEAKAQALQEHLYGENGAAQVSEAEYAAFFAENYVNIEYMIIYTEETAVLDEEGNATYNSKGELISREFTAEEKAEIAARIADAYGAAMTDGDFSALVAKYSDVDMSAYPNGFFLAAQDCADHDIQVASAALEMEVGEVKLLEGDYVTYIIKRSETPTLTELDETALSGLPNFLSVANEALYLDMLSREAQRVTVYPEKMDVYSIVDVASNPNL